MFPVLFGTACALADASIERSFIDWMRMHSILYVGDEYFLRLGVYSSLSSHIGTFNRVHRFRIGHNRFSTLTAAERDQFLVHKVFRSPRHIIASPMSPVASTSCDWREKGVVNPIRPGSDPIANDGWAYASIAAQETQWALSGNALPSLSEAALIDCVQYGTPTFAYDAYDWAIETQGGTFDRLDCYPNRRNECAFNQSCTETTIAGYVVCDFGNETDMAEKCAKFGVLTATLDASALEFVQYRSGVYDYNSCQPESQSHEVAIVGFGEDDGTPYWILRNSWGVGWGEEGYMRFQRGNNLCGIAQLVLLPQVRWNADER
jgi:hypothetical protein